jgi:hypothetical protein
LYYITAARKATRGEAEVKPAGQQAGPASKFGFRGFEAGFTSPILAEAFD